MIIGLDKMTKNDKISKHRLHFNWKIQKKFHIYLEQCPTVNIHASHFRIKRF